MTLDNFVRVVRAIVPKVVGTEPGLRTRGWWRDHAGKVSTEIVSGKKGDPLWAAARAVLEEIGAPRQFWGLAEHVEVKLAALMRREGQPSAELVINNVVCGSLNPEFVITCERMLPKVLRPGQRLTVEGIDQRGNRYSRTYEGEPER